ncbi:vitamin B12 transporter BtuB precursor [mine drainage metagenome]|uniref:Vitamin B12 transporter BtuB n=1 Tax=mine drainage metagenome TaxID=410659 RepID=A0A1J5SFQ5_9ZZZZ
MTQLLPTRSSGWFWMACGAVAAAVPSIARSQEQASNLDAFVVSASRTPQDPRTVPSTVTSLSLDDLQASQVFSLSTALSEVPGVSVVNTGAVGGQSAVFIRGANSDQVLFVVDGIRMNTRSADYSNFLGGADLGGIDRIEVLQGPQGTLYGSSAMGGVILIDTAHGCGTPSGSLGTEAGSFGTYAGSASLEGGTKSLGYSVSASHLTTNNDRPFNRDNDWNWSTRIEDQVASGVLVGATYRGEYGQYQEPGSTLYPSQGLVMNRNDLFTTYAQVQPDSSFTSRVTAALHHTDYDYTASWGDSVLRNTRRILDWQNVWNASSKVELVAGANLEQSRFVAGGGVTDDHISSGYLSGTFKPVHDLSVIGGLRYDQFSSFGSATTGRFGAAYFIESTGTTIRSTYGTAFTAPGSDDRFGVPAWGQLPNPTIRPERSRGWDFGVEQSVLAGRVTLGATAFRTLYRDLFDWQTTDFVTYQGMTVNRSRASVRGLEFSADGRITSRLFARLAYTYLDSRDDTTGARLVRRPRQVADAELRGRITSAWQAGAGLHLVGDRTDLGGSLGGYATVRVFTSYDLGHGITASLRVENLLDRKYQEVIGYPALPFGAYGSVVWKF